MRILIVNPNTTASMTEKAVAAAQSVAADNTVINGVQPEMGPVSIEGFYDEVFAIPGMIGELLKADSPDGVVLACFDDTGLDAARCALNVPVIGIGEAAYHVASLVSNRFGVVTTLSRSIPALEHNLQKYGLSARCSGVRASDVPVLALEKEGSGARDRISAEIRKCIEHDGSDAIVLGCAGMTDLAQALQQEHGVPVIDGVVSAVKLIEALVGMNCTTSKFGAYAKPGYKPYLGAMAPFAPSR